MVLGVHSNKGRDLASNGSSGIQNLNMRENANVYYAQCQHIFAKAQESIFRTWLIVPFLTPSIKNFEKVVQLFLFKECP